MKKISFCLLPPALLFLPCNHAQANTIKTDEQALTTLVNQLTDCIKTRSILAFYAFFIERPVNWLGAYQRAPSKSGQKTGAERK
ncbi:hypothetical protein [Pedobacter sp. ASV12]|uniref:hypothetical protein n=1 Tax=Pedobacter sp. ASV12 TaxID=2795120 RepID=UPI0018EB38F2|nr:hypothetical protein [Pedobacter sp. ASV12]